MRPAGHKPAYIIAKKTAPRKARFFKPNGLEASVDQNHGREPAVAGDVGQTDLQAVNVFGIVDQTELQTVDGSGIVDHTQLHAGKGVRGVAQTPLHAGEILFVVVDKAGLQTGELVGQRHQGGLPAFEFRRYGQNPGPLHAVKIIFGIGVDEVKLYAGYMLGGRTDTQVQTDDFVNVVVGGGGGNAVPQRNFNIGVYLWIC